MKTLKEKIVSAYWRLMATLVLLKVLVVGSFAQTFWVTNNSPSSQLFWVNDSTLTPVFNYAAEASEVFSFAGNPAWGLGEFYIDGGFPTLGVDYASELDGGYFSLNLSADEITYTSASVIPEPTAASIFMLGFVSFLTFFVLGSQFRMVGRVTDA